jgi:hypothetical protein
MSLRRNLALLLTLLLLFAQQAAFAHAVSHLGREAPAKEQLAHSKLCGKCVGFEKLTHAAVGATGVLRPIELSFVRPSGAEYVFSARTRVGFRSRAPPVFP